MQALKRFLMMFIAIPLTVIGLVGLLGALLEGKYLKAVGIVFVLIAYFWFCGWEQQRYTQNLRKAVRARGMNLDYFVNYLESGVAIDLAKKKVLVGNLKRGKILTFDEVKSIEWEDSPFHGKIKYNIYVNTNDFQVPRLGAGFASHKNMRDTSYAKLNAALKCS